jgi:hypothetical protein
VTYQWRLNLNKDCYYCGDKGVWMMGCDCCDDVFMACAECAEGTEYKPRAMNSLTKPEEFV